MSEFHLLQRLPEELLQDVLEYLGTHELRSFNLVSRWCYNKATPLLWREVELVDCRVRHEDATDEHDDTPIIKKLLILATKPWLASHVQCLAHRCHLPPPAIFNELPRSPFTSQTLSTDPRTIRLAELAVKNMVKVSTLRIIFGHPTLNDALLRCFFDKHRQKTGPVRRLWLENCRIPAGLCMSLPEQPYNLPLDLDFGGLESIRFRRMPLLSGPWASSSSKYYVVHARSNTIWEMQDGMGGQCPYTVNEFSEEQTAGQAHLNWLAADKEPASIDEGVVHDSVSPLERLYGFANHWDDRIYEQLLAAVTPAEQLLLSERHVPSYRARSGLAYRGPCTDPTDLERNVAPLEWKRAQREKLPSSKVALALLSNATHTITSLTLDWVITMPAAFENSTDVQSQHMWTNTFVQLFSLRFPHLRAFQFRNAVVAETRLPQGLYLLDRTHVRFHDLRPSQDCDDSALRNEQNAQVDTICLNFMEAHPKLQCLAWPMDCFFSENPLTPDIARRVETVINNLGRTLVDLRVDALYRGNTDSQTESSNSPNPDGRTRRRKFIEKFASKMTNVESIKVEGGVPRDERRETIRALHSCPLKRIILIGIACPIGNTWGAEGCDLAQPLSHDEVEDLEGEDKDAVWQYGDTKPEPPESEFKFEASWGWPASPPMAHTLASFHADTVTELKFCGYRGSADLLSPTPITTPMLAPLKHFHKLQSLIMSMWLSTSYEGSPQDAEIISYWLNARSPSSTALVLVSDDDPEGWEKELRTKYASDAIAWRITNFIGPFLSEQAKSREGGVHIRASFCIGDWGGIFDTDLTIGKGVLGSDVCLDFSGPREELEHERRKTKLESRRWF